MALISSKILPREKLVKVVADLKKKGKKIGVTNGAFDLLHAGHAKYLEDAKKLCDVLVVSVNTDESVRLYKDPRRPINSQDDRAVVVAALASVDYVTFHSERRMRDTLLALKPDLYIKGEDYNPDSLTSKHVLDAWGGKIAFVPLLEGKSTTRIIGEIAQLYEGTPIELPVEKKKEQKAVFLDRDGTINKEYEYVSEEKDFELLPGVLEGLKKLQEMGYLLVVVTNQAGIGLGYYTKEDFYRVNRKMLKAFHENGIIISKIYFCPHSLADNCNCHKPKTGMLERARDDMDIVINKSWMVGNTTMDIQAGVAMGCRTILIESEYSGSAVKSDYTAKDLVEAAKIIQAHS